MGTHHPSEDQHAQATYIYMQSLRTKHFLFECAIIQDILDFKFISFYYLAFDQ